MFFRENYTLEMIISAVVTMAVILMCIRIYLKVVNKRSGIQKPDWLSESEFEKKFGNKKK